MLRLWHTVCVFSQSRGEDMKKYWMAVHHCEVGTYEDYVEKNYIQPIKRLLEGPPSAIMALY